MAAYGKGSEKKTANRLAVAGTTYDSACPDRANRLISDDDMAQDHATSNPWQPALNPLLFNY